MPKLDKFMLEKISKCNFDKVYVDTDSNEIKNFCKLILSNLNLENFLKKSSSQRKKLSNMFSPKEEHNAITKFLKKI